MTLSVHDNLLVSYEVHCEQRIITLRTEFRVEGKPTEFTDVVFEGVQGYHFENDAFGNIIFDVSNMPAEGFPTQYGAEISELYHMTGSPAWAADLASAPDYIRGQGINAFILFSSLGLSGWGPSERAFPPSDRAQRATDGVTWRVIPSLTRPKIPAAFHNGGKLRPRNRHKSKGHRLPKRRQDNRAPLRIFVAPALR
jgi:hypothetical protein